MFWLLNHKGTVNQSTWNQVVSFDVSQKSQQESGVGSNFLNLNLFIRLPNMLIPENEKSNKNIYLLISNKDTKAENPELILVIY